MTGEKVTFNLFWGLHRRWPLTLLSSAIVEAAPRSRCPPTCAPAPPRSPPQAAGPPQEHERAQLSGASVEVLRCMRTGPLPPAVGAPGANLSGAEEALIFFEKESHLKLY